MARYLIPYRLTRVARQIFRKVDAEDFWSLAESFGRKNIKAYIELDVDRRTMRIKSFDHVEGFDTWRSFSTASVRVVTDTRQLSALSRTLGSPKAALALERGASLDEASLYVTSKQETISRLLRELIKLFEKIRKLSPDRQDSAKILGATEEFTRS